MNRADSYLAGLNDGRSVWLGGRKICVLEHEAFAGTIQSVAGLFGMLDDPKFQDLIGFPSPSDGRIVHLSFLVPECAEDLRKRRVAAQIWSEATSGMMSRLSDYARSRLTGWYASRHSMDADEPHFSEKISGFFEKSRDENRFLAIVQRDPQIDRSRQYDPAAFQDSGLLRITKKTREGVFVSGAKMIATSAPYAQDFLVYPVVKLEAAQKSAANFFIVPADARGLHIICRESFAKPPGEEDDFPLSSRYDEMDALLVFDDVFIPWEHVLVSENPEAVWKLKQNRHSVSLGYHQAMVRLHVKMEFVTALAFSIADASGAYRFLHVQEKLGELVTQTEAVRALIIASEAEAERTEDGVCLPRLVSIETAKSLGSSFYPRAIEILQLIAAGGLIQVPSSVHDLQSEISPLMNECFRGANLDAVKRTRLFKLAWDLIGTPFGSRHELYERFYSGDPVRNLAALSLHVDKDRLLRKLDRYLS